MLRTYHELIRLKTFEERFDYVNLSGKVGEETFGSDRYLNQALYRTKLWKKDVRNKIILRDNGCDLAMDGYEIHGRIYIHHLNPVTIEDLESGDPKVVDPDFLVCVSFDTHNAIHFGDKRLLPRGPIERKPGDTCPWR